MLVGMFGICGLTGEVGTIVLVGHDGPFALVVATTVTGVSVGMRIGT